jgi:hypothetical protein
MKRTAIALSAVLCLLATLSAQSTETSDFCHIAWKTDCVSAMKQFRLEAAKGDTHAMINIAAMYAQGWGVLPDDTASLGWHLRAAQTGDADAMTLLAEDYAKGHGVPISDIEGASWYRRAANHGSADGMNGLAGLYAKGAGVPKSDVQALGWYMRAKATSSPAYPPYREATVAIATLVKRMTPGEIARAKAGSQRLDR